MKKKKLNKRVLVSIIAITLLAGGVAFAMWQINEPKEIEETGVSQEDLDQPITEADERQLLEDGEDTQDPQANTDQNENGSSVDGPEDTRNNVPPTMTSWNYDANRQVASVRAHVDGVSSGTCRVVFEKSGQSAVTREAPIGLQGSTYVCQGFDVERSAFPAGGEWQVRVEFFSNKARGASHTEVLNIR